MADVAKCTTSEDMRLYEMKVRDAICLELVSELPAIPKGKRPPKLVRPFTCKFHKVECSLRGKKRAFAPGLFCL
jgi:hypothetical protein